MDTRELKIAKTEALFRDVNERIAETSERFDCDEAVARVVRRLNPRPRPA